MKYLLLLILFLVFLSSGCNPKKETTSEINNNESVENKIDDNELLSFMVYGEDFISSIALPETWTVDMEYAHQVGVNGFFYQKNYGIGNTPAGIVLQLSFKQNDESKLEDYVEYDLNSILEYYEGSSVEKLDWKILNKDYNIIVYNMKIGKRGQLQYCSYFDVGLRYFAKIYVMIRDENLLNEIINDYKKCLENSYFSGIGLKSE